ncbi:hypothetical protein LWI29_020749 [Acer saccharum]|uniref:Proteasomal ATPase second OB domain-containing protein n=1 Tax=Acer saccharum TaxID=4024 RepID=A0AA39T590_ACESA|nr:hypothetical protein LWI29_020749 [Acer saccharum]
MTTDDIVRASRLLDNEIRVLKISEMNPEDEVEEDGANIDLDSQRKDHFLLVVGLVDPDKLKPGDLVGVNKDSELIFDTLPSECDSRVKAMEVDEKPAEDYTDIGGLEKQIQELVEAIVLPKCHLSEAGRPTACPGCNMKLSMSCVFRQAVQPQVNFQGSKGNINLETSFTCPKR